MRPLRIANAHGFWGDRIDAAAELLRLDADIDFLTLDFLAEVSMSIMAAQREKDPSLGYARDFVDVVRCLTPYFRDGGRCRVITNAGGLNPHGCAVACQEVLQAAGCGDKRIAVVSGDDVLSQLRSNVSAFNNLDTDQPLATVAEHLMTANAYLGAEALLPAISDGADLIITGRVADPSLTVAPCVHHFAWSIEDYDRIAGATVAGHLIECGTQVTGGISTDWLTAPLHEAIGFPIVEVADDGSCVVTKPQGSGGNVTEATVKEQLVYEIGDPAAYLSPDATVSFQSLEVASVGLDRVRVQGAVGTAPPPTYKVSATYRDGFWSASCLVVCGTDAPAKAKAAAEVVRQQLRDRGSLPDQYVVEILGAGGSGLLPTASEALMASGGAVSSAMPPEVVLRIAVADPQRKVVEAFTRSVMPLITAGPPGTTGYADGRPRVHPRIGYWPCLVGREAVAPQVDWIGAPPAAGSGDVSEDKNATPLDEQLLESESSLVPESEPTVANDGTLMSFAYARSGDKGRNANIGVIARRPEDYAALGQWLSCQRTADYFGLDLSMVKRYELPKLDAYNFVLEGILENNLRTDAQGKALAMWLLRMPCQSLTRDG